MAEAQRVLASETLRHEIQTLNPALVVIVAEGNYDSFVYEALRVKQGVDDHFECVASWKHFLYFRGRMGGWPPILWMKHPERKKIEYLAEAEAQAGRLMFSHG